MTSAPCTVVLKNVLLNFDSKLATGILNRHKHFVRFTHCVESDIKFELRDAKLNTRKSNLLIHWRIQTQTLLVFRRRLGRIVIRSCSAKML